MSDYVGARSGRKKGSNKGIARRHHEDRYADAIQRQKDHDALSVKQRLAKLDDRPGRSQKERERLRVASLENRR